MSQPENAPQPENAGKGQSTAKKFAILCQITRAQHFAWREAVVAVAPDVDPVEIVTKMWEVTGKQTGGSYARRLDAGRDLPRQVAECIAWSSDSMGDDARVELSDDTDDAFVRHCGCPWYQWHARKDLLAEDRPGCDAWIGATLGEINKKLGSDLRFETLASMPDGDDSCLRRIWLQTP